MMNSQPRLVWSTIFPNEVIEVSYLFNFQCFLLLPNHIFVNVPRPGHS